MKSLYALLLAASLIAPASATVVTWEHQGVVIQDTVDKAGLFGEQGRVLGQFTTVTETIAFDMQGLLLDKSGDKIAYGNTATLTLRTGDLVYTSAITTMNAGIQVRLTDNVPKVYEGKYYPQYDYDQMAFSAQTGAHTDDGKFTFDIYSIFGGATSTLPADMDFNQYYNFPSPADGGKGSSTSYFCVNHQGSVCTDLELYALGYAALNPGAKPVAPSSPDAPDDEAPIPVVTRNLNEVPEPSSPALMLGAVASLVFFVRRRPAKRGQAPHA